MSHWTDIECDITDLKILESAVKELGCEFHTNGKARGFVGRLEDCDAFIRHPDCRYDIRVLKDGDKYKLSTDFWRGRVKRVYGKGNDDLGKIKEMYNVHKAEALCRRRRLRTKRVVTNKSIKLEVFV